LKKIIIFPYCGTGKEALECLAYDQECIAFLTDDAMWIGKSYRGIPICSRESIVQFESFEFLLVHGSQKNYKDREKIAESFVQYPKATLIHSSAQISKSAKIGKNVLIMANVVITSDVEVSDDVIILPNTTIHHDSKIGRYTLIAGNVLVAGAVNIAKNCYIGAGSNIKNGLEIAEKTLVGMGANVVHSIIKTNQIVKGNPAK
jgi:acetyltransferase EpsM